MQRFRRTWLVVALLIGSLGLALRSVGADVDTLRRGLAPTAEAVRYLLGDALIASASTLALVGVLTARSWAPVAMLTWMVILLADMAWVLFIAVGSNGPPVLLRAGAWSACAFVGAIAVHWIRRVWAGNANNAAA